MTADAERPTDEIEEMAMSFATPSTADQASTGYRPAGALLARVHRAGGDGQLQFPVPSDPCRERLPVDVERDVARLAEAARKSQSGQAFRPAFSASGWRTFASFCVSRRLPAGSRVLIPGSIDRTLRFVVAGTLWREHVATRTTAPTSANLVPAGSILGEECLFVDGTRGLDVRTLEDSVVLELSWQRKNELTAAHPELAFGLLRAAGAVIAAGGRAVDGDGELGLSPPPASRASR